MKKMGPVKGGKYGTRTVTGQKMTVEKAKYK